VTKALGPFPNELPRLLDSDAFRENEALRSLGRMLLVFKGSTAWPSRVVGREAALEEKMDVEKMGVPVLFGVLGGMFWRGSGPGGVRLRSWLSLAVR
jgi:hypothetical protein